MLLLSVFPSCLLWKLWEITGCPKVEKLLTWWYVGTDSLPRPPNYLFSSCCKMKNVMGTPGPGAPRPKENMSDGKPSLTSPSISCSKPLTPTKHFILFTCTCTHTCAHARGSQKGMSGLLEQRKYLLNKLAYLSSASQHSCKQ